MLVVGALLAEYANCCECEPRRRNYTKIGQKWGGGGEGGMAPLGPIVATPVFGCYSQKHVQFRLQDVINKLHNTQHDTLLFVLV